MPRRPRHEEAGAVHHVFARGVDRQLIFRDDADRELYLALIALVVRQWHWECLEYCLMSNHLHLLVRTREPTLGRCMHRLHSLYAANFNHRHGRVGHVFQNRYGSSRIWTCERLADVRRYVTENPVSAGLCRTPADWPWGSAGARAAGTPWWLASSADVGAVYAVLADVPDSVAA